MILRRLLTIPALLISAALMVHPALEAQATPPSPTPADSKPAVGSGWGYSEARTSRLRAVQSALGSDPSLKIPNTSISVGGDNAVTIEYYKGIPAKDLALLHAAQRQHGADVRLVPLDGQLVQSADNTAGGYGVMSGQGGRCTLGFNMIKNGEYHFITAGHCVDGGDNYWYLGRKVGGVWQPPTDNDYLGYKTAVYGPPYADLAAIKYSPMANDVLKYGTVYHYTSTHQDITSIGDPSANTWVCASGSTSGKRCGTIQDECADVTYTDGTHIRCMIKVDICTALGDSGGPLWRYSAGLGVQSGGVTNCGSGGKGPSYFSRLSDALYHWGLNVY
jgi:hypothetical protein